jgi:hypothetical protein
MYFASISVMLASIMKAMPPTTRYEANFFTMLQDKMEFVMQQNWVGMILIHA